MYCKLCAIIMFAYLLNDLMYVCEFVQINKNAFNTQYTYISRRFWKDELTELMPVNQIDSSSRLSISADIILRQKILIWWRLRTSQVSGNASMSRTRAGTNLILSPMRIQIRALIQTTHFTRVQLLITRVPSIIMLRMIKPGWASFKYSIHGMFRIKLYVIIYQVQYN